jgi:hypothetical protein
MQSFCSYNSNPNIVPLSFVEQKSPQKREREEREREREKKRMCTKVSRQNFYCQSFVVNVMQ